MKNDEAQMGALVLVLIIRRQMLEISSQLNVSTALVIS